MIQMGLYICTEVLEQRQLLDFLANPGVLSDYHLHWTTRPSPSTQQANRVHEKRDMYVTCIVSELLQ